MEPLVLAFCIIAVLLFGVPFACFLLVFYVSNGQKRPKAEFTLPRGKIYLPYKAQMLAWMQQTRRLHARTLYATAFDGLRLCGKYYEYAPNAPVELMFHGYRGQGERDLCGGVQRCFALGHSALVVDQRAAGSSEGHVISFGINESKDVAAWVELVLRELGPQTKILLTGISMGASTVLLAAGRPLPPNVAGVVADCGYTSAKEIICKVIRQLHLPHRLLYPLVRWGARLYGGFDLEEDTPRRALASCRLPVLFIHGQQDDFVPCQMSLENYNACAGPKQLVTVPNAGHGLSYMLDAEGYKRTLQAFFEPYI